MKIAQKHIKADNFTPFKICLFNFHSVTSFLCDVSCEDCRSTINKTILQISEVASFYEAILHGCTLQSVNLSARYLKQKKN